MPLRGGVGPLMANAILNFHFDYLNTSLISFHEVACPSNWENSDEIGKIDLRFKGGDMLKTLKIHDQNLHKLELMSRVGLPFNYNGCIWTKKITKF